MIHVLIPTYNRSAFITEAIDSVINQKFESWKISIVDNDSTDNTESLIRKKYKRLLKKKFFIINIIFLFQPLIIGIEV